MVARSFSVLIFSAVSFHFFSFMFDDSTDYSQDRIGWFHQFFVRAG